MGSYLSKPGSGTTTTQNDATAANSPKNQSSSTSTNLNFVSGSATNTEATGNFCIQTGPGNSMSSPGNALANAALAGVANKDVGTDAIEKAMEHLLPSAPATKSNHRAAVVILIESNKVGLFPLLKP